MICATYIYAAHAIPDTAESFVGINAVKAYTTTEIVKGEIKSVLTVVSIRRLTNLESSTEFRNCFTVNRAFD